MKLYGIAVPQSVLDAATAVVRNAPDRFTAREIYLAAERANPPAGLNTYRLADRLLKQMKRDGRIQYVGGNEWRRTETPQ